VKSPTGAPAYGADLYTTAAILDPYPHYRNLRELLSQVDRIEAIGPPKWARNNIIRRHEQLPLRLTARRSALVTSSFGPDVASI
jgi:hypothetical protein